MRDVFVLSASDNMIAPSLPSPFLVRSSEVRDMFIVSASDNLTTPSTPIPFPEMSENEMRQQVCYR
jgi:hypothetical protein